MNHATRLFRWAALMLVPILAFGSPTAVASHFSTVPASARSMAPLISVPLQNVDATCEQAGWPASASIDGNFGGSNGWAIDSPCPLTGGGLASPQNIMWQTTTAVTAGVLEFELHQLYSGDDYHKFTNFRLSYTTDAAPTLASSWTELSPISASATKATLTIVGNRVEATVDGTRVDVYTVRTNGATGITGFRLEGLANGAGTVGFYPPVTSNGNIVLTEMEVSAVPADWGDAPDSYATEGGSGGAFHLSEVGATLRLGATVDHEADGQPAASFGDPADGDDTSGADEDGVVFSAPFIDFGAFSTTSSIEITASGVTGDSFISVWLDSHDGAGGGPDGDFGDSDELIIDEFEITLDGTYTIPFTIPAAAQSGTTYLRVRLTTDELSTTQAAAPWAGGAADGEVEDYRVTILDGTSGAMATVSPEAAIGVSSISQSGGVVTVFGVALDPATTMPYVLLSYPAAVDVALTIEGTPNDDTFTIDYIGGNPVPASGLTFNGNDGDDHVIVDFQDAPLSAHDITFNGGDEDTDGDFLTLQNTAGTATYSILSDHTNETDGFVFVEDDGAPSAFNDATITYTGLEPIIVTLTLLEAEFQFNAGANTIEINNGGSDDGSSFIDCVACGEGVTFTNPTDRLEVKAGDGADTVNFDLLDAAGAIPTVIIIQGEEGEDLFNVTPSLTYGMLVDGGDPTMCQGDVLDLVGTNDGQALTIVAPREGNWQFTSHGTINFTDIEIRADAITDIVVTAAWDDNTGYPADEREILFTLTNEGGDEATCISAEIALPSLLNVIAPYPVEVYPAVSLAGAFAGTTWSIDRMLSGDVASITFRGVIDALMPGTHATSIDATAGVPSDDPDLPSATPLETDNYASDDFEVLNIYRFPAKATAISAQYVELPSGLDRVVAGLFQGSPGFNTPLLCRIPDADGVLFTQPGVGNHWKPCGEGLPLPLHVTDMFLDDRTTPGDVLDDRLWLTSWGSAGLYYSDDYGETFTAAEPVLGPKGGWVNVYSITKDAGNVLYISANNGNVYRSFNEGDSWQQVSSLPGASADTPWSMQSHPTESGTIYAGTFGRGVFVSYDYGFNWAPLGDDAINDGLLDKDKSGDDFAGHVFDMAFSPDLGAAAVPNPDEYLFIGTGKGVWRLLLDAAGVPTGAPWEHMAISVTLDNGNVVTPEIRVLAFDKDGTDPDDNLLVGSWGFGAFVNEDPIGGAAFSATALRTGHVSMLLVEPNGAVFAGTEEAGITAISASSVSTASESPSHEVPGDYALEQNYPNPFNPVTTIGFALPETGRVHLAVFDLLGREVRVLASGTLEAGRHTVHFDARNLPSGTYLYRLDTDLGSYAKQLVLMK